MPMTTALSWRRPFLPTNVKIRADVLASAPDPQDLLDGGIDDHRGIPMALVDGELGGPLIGRYWQSRATLCARRLVSREYRPSQESRSSLGPHLGHMTRRRGTSSHVTASRMGRSRIARTATA